MQLFCDAAGWDMGLGRAHPHLTFDILHSYLDLLSSFFPLQEPKVMHVTEDCGF